GWGEPDGRLTRVRVIMRSPRGFCLACDKHQESGNSASTGAHEDSRRTSGDVARRGAPLARKDSHSTPPEFPRLLRDMPEVCAVDIRYIRKKPPPCPQLEQRLSRTSAAISFWVSIQA